MLFCVCKLWIYSTVCTPHIYFKILISMIAGNLVEIIRLPQIQNRKCPRKFNFSEIRSRRLSAYRFRALVSTQGFLSFHDVWYVLFRLSLSYLLSFVVFSLCNLLLSVSRAAPLTLKKKLVNDFRRFGPFLCLNCFTNTLMYYRKNYRFRKAQNWS